MNYRLEQIETVDPWFPALENCRGVEQQLNHHPEGDVFNHSVQVLYWAFRETEDVDLILAAMLHDVGKKIASKGHESYGLEILGNSISEKTQWLIKNHMKFWSLVLGEMRKKSKVEGLISHPWFSDLTLLARWDKMGRSPNVVIAYDRETIIQKLRRITNV